MATALSDHDPRRARAGLDLLPTWALEQKATANRQLITITRNRLAAARRLLADIKSRAWPGWNDKPRSPRNSLRSGGG